MTIRTVADACPGVLRPHQAADGALVRLRLPGGMTTLGQLTALMTASADFADGTVQLTSRGNLQLRGLEPVSGGVDPLLEDAIVEAGLLPSPELERVRNIAASPLTGRRGGLTDLRLVVAELDQLLCAATDLADLPGRFLFGLDDGRGDVAALSCDLGLRAVGPDRAVLLIGGLLGPELALADAPAAVIAAARKFLAVRGAHWHVRELPDRGRELGGSGPAPAGGGGPVGLGVIEQMDGLFTLSVQPPFGVVTPRLLDAVIGIGLAAADALVITPWRTVLVPDQGDGEGLVPLESAGWITSDLAGWAGISACTGAPGCAKAAADVRALTTAAVSGPRRGLPVHVVACGRRCGAPAGRHLEVLVGPDGMVTTEMSAGGREGERRVDRLADVLYPSPE